VSIVKTWSIFILIFFLPEFALDLSARGDQTQEKRDLAALEKEMADRPQEALSIARRAAAANADTEKALYALAAKEQEKHLGDLSLAQALELAEAMEKKLDDSQAARRVRITWLVARGPGLNQEEVRRVLGAPKRNSLQIVYFRQIEQWVYDQPVPALLAFSCTKGQIPRLQTIQTSFQDKK
jgi:hypothetical protein